MKLPYTIIITIILITSVSCGPRFSLRTPDGFAHYNKEKKLLKYISPEGVRIKFYAIDNDPYGNLKMWSTAVDNHLKIRGYKQIGKKDLATPENRKGTFTEYQYIYNAENHIYGIALFLDKDNIYIGETGGAEKDYKLHRSELIRSLQSFKTK